MVFLFVVFSKCHADLRLGFLYWFSLFYGFVYWNGKFLFIYFLTNYWN